MHLKGKNFVQWVSEIWQEKRGLKQEKNSTCAARGDAMESMRRGANTSRGKEQPWSAASRKWDHSPTTLRNCIRPTTQRTLNTASSLEPCRPLDLGTVRHSAESPDPQKLRHKVGIFMLSCYVSGNVLLYLETES